MIEVTEVCGLCGGELDNHDVRVTIRFAAGLRNGNRTLTEPWQLKDWPLCWACFTGDGSRALRAALADDYLETVDQGSGQACRVTCSRGKPRRRRLFSVLSGSRGEPEAWARCPVCLGACEVERSS